MQPALVPQYIKAVRTCRYDGGLQAEARQLDAAAQCARAALTLSSGAHGPAWPLLALVLSAQQRIGAAAAVVDAGLSQAGPQQEWLLRKIKVRKRRPARTRDLAPACPINATLLQLNLRHRYLTMLQEVGR